MKEMDSGYLRIPSVCQQSGKSQDKKKAKKDLFVCNVAGQNLGFIINNKNENKMKQHRPQVSG